jgi:MFS family permease
LHHLQGTLIGQLLFGMVADQLGRKLMFVTTMALVIVGTLGSSLLSWNVWIISVFFCLGTELL